jgi:hypothetical protein
MMARPCLGFNQHRIRVNKVVSTEPDGPMIVGFSPRSKARVIHLRIEIGSESWQETWETLLGVQDSHAPALPH